MSNNLFEINSRYPDGFNVGINIDEPAGQAVPRIHIHLIAWYKGDVKETRGGIREAISEKRNY